MWSAAVIAARLAGYTFVGRLKAPARRKSHFVALLSIAQTAQQVVVVAAAADLVWLAHFSLIVAAKSANKTIDFASSSRKDDSSLVTCSAGRRFNSSTSHRHFSFDWPTF